MYFKSIFDQDKSILNLYPDTDSKNPLSGQV